MDKNVWGEVPKDTPGLNSVKIPSKDNIRIIRGNVYHAYTHLGGYFSFIWKAVTVNFINRIISLLYFVLLLGMRIMH